MVDKADLHDFRGFDHVFGDAEIRFAGGWIAGWVVVDEDESVGVAGDDGSEDFPGMCTGFVDGSRRDRGS